MNIHRFGLTLGLIGVASFASAVDFASLSQPGTGFFPSGSSVTQEGYTFTVLGGTLLGVWGNADPNHPSGGTAGTSLLNYDAFSILQIAAATGGLFDLTLIAVAPWGANQQVWTPSFQVTFTGDQFGGGVVSQTLTVVNGATPTLQPFALAGFTNLENVTVQQGAYTGTGTAWQIDDATLVSAVPEPCSPTILCTGLLGLGWSRRRSAKS